MSCIAKSPYHRSHNIPIALVRQSSWLLDTSCAVGDSLLVDCPYIVHFKRNILHGITVLRQMGIHLFN